MEKKLSGNCSTSLIVTCYSLQLSVTKPGLSAKLAPAKKEVKSTKGVQSAAVKAFLEKREKEEKDKGEYHSVLMFEHFDTAQCSCYVWCIASYEYYVYLLNAMDIEEN